MEAVDFETEPLARSLSAAARKHVAPASGALAGRHQALRLTYLRI
jgi:hypothetical protein